jgi:ketosteroid isomerase-like protein
VGGADLPSSESPVETVLAWHAALNAGDVDRLVAMSTDDVEVGGPRGAGHGADLLREWFGRANVQLIPGRVFARSELVVVEEAGRWRRDEDGSPGEPQAVASVFRVERGRVASVLRYPDVPAALAATGLSEPDDAVGPS